MSLAKQNKQSFYASIRCGTKSWTPNPSLLAAESTSSKKPRLCEGRWQMPSKDNDLLVHEVPFSWLSQISRQNWRSKQRSLLPTPDHQAVLTRSKEEKKWRCGRGEGEVSVELSIGTAALELNLEAFLKTKYRYTMWPRYTFPGHVPNGLYISLSAYTCSLLLCSQLLGNRNQLRSPSAD